jgi:hypothetical protein
VSSSANTATCNDLKKNLCLARLFVEIAAWTSLRRNRHAILRDCLLDAEMKKEDVGGNYLRWGQCQEHPDIYRSNIQAQKPFSPISLKRKKREQILARMSVQHSVRICKMEAVLLWKGLVAAKLCDETISATQFCKWTLAERVQCKADYSQTDIPALKAENTAAAKMRKNPCLERRFVECSVQRPIHGSPRPLSKRSGNCRVKMLAIFICDRTVAKGVQCKGNSSSSTCTHESDPPQ